MAIDMTNAKYITRYFLNGNKNCHNEHCFDFGKKKPIVPQIGERVILNYIIDDSFPDDKYDHMSEHWYEVMGIDYSMDGDESDDTVIIDIKAVDVTDEVMEEEEIRKDKCGCCGGCC